MALIIIALLLMPAQVFAATEISAKSYYFPPADQYRVDYDKSQVQSSANYELYFTSPTGQIFTGTYNFAPTGIHWLTCNGTYRLNFYSSGGSLMYSTADIVTTGIINPTCSSYADGIMGNDAFGAKYNTDGSISWNPSGGASKYEIWKDGAKVGETTGTSYPNASPGSYTIIGKDSSGGKVGQSDLVVGDGCDVCEKLNKLLQCPGWDQVMNDLKNTLVKGLGEYFGEVPPPPTVEQISQAITPPLPPLDTAVPEANITPSVPTEFNNGPIDFDITKGPEIPVVDGSQPFEIYEPDKYIKSDPAGEMVFPGDPRNSSNGIKRPDTIQTDHPLPVPSTPNGTPGPTIPPSDMPVPSGGASTMPIPEAKGGPGPIPGKGG